MWAGKTCKTYYGGIDLDFTLEKLLDSIRSYLDRGFTAVKIKVGPKNLDEDISRVRAVWELIGDGITFMVDATGVPLAMGENPHTIHEFEYAFEQAGWKYTVFPSTNTQPVRW